MKFELSKKDKDSFLALNDVLDHNVDCTVLINNYMEYGYTQITADDVERLMLTGLSSKDAFITLLQEFLELDSEKKADQFLIEKNHILDFRPYDRNDFINNPYTLKLNEIKEKATNGIKIAFNYFEPYEGFLLDYGHSEKEDGYIERNRYSYFEEKTPYLVLLQKNTVWMSITPFEIETMKEPLEQTRGKVLTFGLGLGYFAYMAARKKEVTEVKVIEANRSVIDLYHSDIEPYLEEDVRKKIKIECKNAYAYLEKSKDYDMLFVDIYHNEIDGLKTYAILEKRAKKIKLPFKINYWIENAILTSLRRYVIDTLYCHMEGIEMEKDEYVIAVEEALEDMEFVSFSQIENLITDEGLKEFAARLNLNA